METVLANVFGKTRRATLHGREYIVAPLTMIVPGVLNGSKGALYYPPEEIAKSVDSWNGMPLVLGHPTRDGSHVSARSPEVADSHGLGTVYNATVTADGRLTAEGWFDVAAVRKTDHRVLNRLERSEATELSTGLFTHDQPAANGSHVAGKPYAAIARNLRPDHLAILPDQTGACSIRDGCGVLVNADRSILQRLMDWLTANLAGESKPACPCDSAGCYRCGERTDNADWQHRWELQAKLAADGAETWIEDAADGEVVYRQAGKTFTRKYKLDPLELIDGPPVEVAKIDGYYRRKAGVANANPEGCNQYTGPGCGGGGGSKSAKDLEPKPHEGLAKLKSAGKGTYTTEKGKTFEIRHKTFGGAHGYAAYVDGKKKTKYKIMSDNRAENWLDSLKATMNKAADDCAHLVANAEHPTTIPPGDSSMNRAETISFLATNCDCWKGDEKTLNTLPDAKLAMLKAATERLAVAEPVLNAVKEARPTLAVNAMPEFLKKKIAAKKTDDEEDEDDDEEEDKKKKPTGNAAVNPPTDAEWLATAPPGIQSAVRNAMEVERAERKRLLEQFTANVTDANEKKAIVLELHDKPLDVLRILIPAARSVANAAPIDPIAYYLGAAGGPANLAANADFDEDDVLRVPTVNWDEIAKSQRKQGA